MESVRSVREAKESLQVDRSLVDAQADQGVLVVGREVLQRYKVVRQLQHALYNAIRDEVVGPDWRAQDHCAFGDDFKPEFARFRHHQSVLQYQGR